MSNVVNCIGCNEWFRKWEFANTFCGEGFTWYFCRSCSSCAPSRIAGYLIANLFFEKSLDKGFFLSEWPRLSRRIVEFLAEDYGFLENEILKPMSLYLSPKGILCARNDVNQRQQRLIWNTLAKPCKRDESLASCIRKASGLKKRPGRFGWNEEWDRELDDPIVRVPFPTTGKVRMIRDAGGPVERAPVGYFDSPPRTKPVVKSELTPPKRKFSFDET